MFLLSELSHLHIKVGLYRDDLLSVSSLGQQMREISEQVIHHVHRESNHPAHVLRNITIEVQRRLTLLSSNHTMFEPAKAPFQDALTRAG